MRTVVSGLTTPTSIAFLGADDFFVIEKNTGQVKRVVGGAVAVTRARSRGQLRVRTRARQEFSTALQRLPGDKS